jgi:DNA-binding NtrC family response regulator
LFYRLRVIELAVAPLRERGMDVLLLAAHFVENFRRQIGRGPSRISESAAQMMMDYHWPGNVRELKNAIERAIVLGQGTQILPEDLGLNPASPTGFPLHGSMTLAQATRRYIDYVLDQVGGNKTKACEILGIGRATLYNKLQEP